MMRINVKTLLVFVIGALVIGALEFSFDGGSLLYAMLFLIALAQGPVAIVAAVDIVKSDWVKPYKADLLSVRHVILFVVLLFIVFLAAGKLHLYEWHEHQNAWLEPQFFGIRNIVLLLISWLMANQYAKASLANDEKKVMWSVLWLLTYVVSQSLVAFDWVMSLEYPWISTLFGAYFFVEAFYMGLALAAIITFFKYQTLVDNFSEKTFQKSQMDMMTLFFGFSIFWAYQFFSQYIVVWYGNIPEEVAYLTRRLDMFSDTLYLVPAILFVAPFWILLSRKMKANPKVVMVIGFLVWGGFLLERFFMLRPNMILHPLITPLELIIGGIVFVVTVRNGNTSLSGV